MIANATARRRANAFAQALDERAPSPEAIDGATGSGPSSHEERPGNARKTAYGAESAERHADPAQDGMLALVEGLGRISPPQLDPEVKTTQRAQLMAAMEAACAEGKLDPDKVVLPGQRDRRQEVRRASLMRPVGAFRPRSQWGRRLAVSGLAISAAATGLGGATAASSDALPGDTLYTLKRGMEDLRLSLADDETDRGQVHLEMARTRLKEAGRLLERSKAGALGENELRDVRTVLSGVEEEAAAGHRLLTKAYHKHGSLGPIQALASFTDWQQTQWTRLSDRLPGQLQQEGARVSLVLEAIEQQVVPLRPLLPERESLPGGGERHREGPLLPGAPGSPSSSEQRQAPAPPALPREGKKGNAPASGSSAAPPSEQEERSGEGGVSQSPAPTRSQAQVPESGTEVPGAKVTLPPLLPGLLPDLSLKEEDD